MFQDSTQSKALQFLLAFIVATAGFVYINNESSSFENLALGTQTSSYQAKNTTGESIHFLHIDSAEQKQYENFAKHCKDSVLLFLGNSQTHSVNQLNANDKNYVELIARSNPKPTLAFSYPNANLQEHLLTLDYVTNKLKVKKLILPVFMDDLREDGIRDAFFSRLYAQHYRLESNSVIASQLNGLLSKSSTENPGKVEERNNGVTIQERSEEFLNAYLDKNTSVWPKRETMRGQLFIWLYMLRNTIFGIRPSTVRHMIAETYQKNFLALQAILDLAYAKNMDVYLYIPPIRNDAPLPYDLNEYKQFKTDLMQVAKYSNARLKDYSSIVPGKYWGYKDPTNFIDKREIDYMHFQFSGHQILADSLTVYLKN